MSVNHLAFRQTSTMKLILFFLFCLLNVGVGEKISLEKDKTSSTRLYGSRDARDGQFPYVTFHIQKFGRSYLTCTGSLIKENWAITAGHCVIPNGNPKNHLVTAGKVNMGDYVKARYGSMPMSQNIDEKKYDLQERRAAAVYQHPDYKLGSHDVGLVKLSKPFVINNRVKPIPISRDSFDTRSDCIITGFGLVEKNARRYFLQYINDMPAKPARLCKFQKSRDVICLGDTTRGICHGDSGGSLVCGGYIRGVASNGLSKDGNCGKGIIEQYYTDTEINGQWINSVRNSTRKSKSKKTKP